MLTRRSLLRRAVAAVAGASLAAVSRWMPSAPAAKADDFILDEPVHVVPDRDWKWYVDTNVLIVNDEILASYFESL